MAEEKISVLDALKKKLEEELQFKKECDNGEHSYWDTDYDEQMVLQYSRDSSRWNDIFQIIDGANSLEITEGVQAFLQDYGEEYKQYIPPRIISEIQQLAKRTRFEEAVMRDDVVEYFSNKSKEELENEFGTEVARMKDFDQKNPHHCYDLLGHTLHTVDGIKRDGLTPEQYKELRISAFLHDIGKPVVAKMHPKIKGQQVFYGHAEKSAEIAGKMLRELGYTSEQVDRMAFYIGHHDDFISYKSNEQISPELANNEYIRGITPETVAEIMFQNEYESEFKKQGLNKDQIRYMCYALARGKEPHFSMGGKDISIHSSMQDTISFIQNAFAPEKIYTAEYGTVGETDVRLHLDRHSLEDYQMLLQLCRADANAQSEIVEMNGKQVSSRAEKVGNMDNIDSCLPQAKRIFDLVKLSNLFLGNIAKASPTQEVKDEKISQLSSEALYYLEEFGDTPWHNHTDILSWLDLANKPSAFLVDLKKKIEEQRDMAITDKVDVESFNELYDEDTKNLDRITKTRARKETTKQLETQLTAEESEQAKIKEAESLLVQVNKERREER